MLKKKKVNLPWAGFLEVSIVGLIALTEAKGSLI